MTQTLWCKNLAQAAGILLCHHALETRSVTHYTPGMHESTLYMLAMPAALGRDCRWTPNLCLRQVGLHCNLYSLHEPCTAHADMTCCTGRWTGMWSAWSLCRIKSQSLSEITLDVRTWSCTSGMSLTLHVQIGLAAQADELGCGLRGPCAPWSHNPCVRQTCLHFHV